MTDYILIDKPDEFLSEQNALLHEDIKRYRADLEDQKSKTRFWIGFFWVTQLVEAMALFFWLPEPLDREFIEGVIKWLMGGFFAFIALICFLHHFWEARGSKETRVP